MAARQLVGIDHFASHFSAIDQVKHVSATVGDRQQTTAAVNPQMHRQHGVTHSAGQTFRWFARVFVPRSTAL